MTMVAPTSLAAGPTVLASTSLVPSATSITCQVVSAPASTWTIVYSSGDTRIYPATAFTAATTVTESESATIIAQCYTLTPGESSLPLFTDVGMTCLSTLFPGIIDF